MSAGICIMNKNAIALATDSAVTIGSHLAIHNSANKLFAISNIAPVGVIIYADADLMSVPVEIIIKQYKKYLGNNTFDALKGYVDEFFKFLVKNKHLFHFDHNEKSLIMNICVDLLQGMTGDYQALIRSKVNEVNRDLLPNELSQIQNELFHVTNQFIDDHEYIPDFHMYDYICSKYLEDIKRCINSYFPWIVKSALDKLAYRICEICDKNFFRNGSVGLAFAGYGDNAIFPTMIHILISGVVDDKVRYIINEEVKITESNDAAITPLAQTDVIQTFLFGINDSFIHEIGNEIPLQIQNCLQNMDDSFFREGKKGTVQQELNSATDNIINQIINKAQNQFLYPITQAVATLPVEELALLAESMINITSLRRKVAIDSNIGTVGGPIDVAIISKSDGFIWMKRKHYFDKDYNPQYFYSHFMLSGGDYGGNTTNE